MDGSIDGCDDGCRDGIGGGLPLVLELGIDECLDGEGFEYVVEV